MKRIVPIAGLVLFAAVVFVASPAASDEAGGKAIFLAQKCNLCHAVSSAGIEAQTKSEALKGPDLLGVGSRHEKGWFPHWLHREVEMNGQKHKKKFTGSDEELTALVDWLLEQK